MIRLRPRDPFVHCRAKPEAVGTCTMWTTSSIRVNCLQRRPRCTMDALSLRNNAIGASAGRKIKGFIDAAGVIVTTPRLSV